MLHQIEAFISQVYLVRKELRFDKLQSRTPIEYYRIHIPFAAKLVASKGVKQTTRMW